MRGSSKRVLFFAESATLAHVCRPYVLAQILAERGWEVHFAVDSHYRFVLSGRHIAIHPMYSRSPEEFARALRSPGVIFPYELLARYADAERRLIDQVRPDLVIGDLRPSLSVSARRSSVPYAALANAYWSPFVAQRTVPIPTNKLLAAARWSQSASDALLSGFTRWFQRAAPKLLRGQLSGLNRLRREHGFLEFSDYFTGFSDADWTLYADIPVLFRMSEELPDCHRFIGHIAWAPEVGMPAEFLSVRDDRPVVYVSLGSSGSPAQLASMLAVLERQNVRVLVATAGLVDKRGWSGNAFFAPYLPGDQAAALATVAITNGGSPSTYQALMHGVPVIGVASNLDQLLAMERVDAFGAGKLLRADTFSRRRFREAFEALRGSSPARMRANTLAQHLRGFTPAEQFPLAVRALMRRQASNGRARRARD